MRLYLLPLDGDAFYTAHTSIWVSCSGNGLVHPPHYTQLSTTRTCTIHHNFVIVACRRVYLGLEFICYWPQSCWVCVPWPLPLNPQCTLMVIVQLPRHLPPRHKNHDTMMSYEGWTACESQKCAYKYRQSSLPRGCLEPCWRQQIQNEVRVFLTLLIDQINTFLRGFQPRTQRWRRRFWPSATTF